MVYTIWMISEHCDLHANEDQCKQHIVVSPSVRQSLSLGHSRCSPPASGSGTVLAGQPASGVVRHWLVNQHQGGMALAAWLVHQHQGWYGTGWSTSIRGWYGTGWSTSIRGWYGTGWSTSIRGWYGTGWSTSIRGGTALAGPPASGVVRHWLVNQHQGGYGTSWSTSIRGWYGTDWSTSIRGDQYGTSWCNSGWHNSSLRTSPTRFGIDLKFLLGNMYWTDSVDTVTHTFDACPTPNACN